MQLKFNDRKINILDGKITGITSNSVDDINYFFDNTLSKKIYKISLKICYYYYRREKLCVNYFLKWIYLYL